MHRYLLLAALVLLLAACGGQPAAPSTADPTTAPVTAPTTQPDATAAPQPTAAPYPAAQSSGGTAGGAYPAPDTGSSDATRTALETAARDRLAQHLGVQPAMLTLVRSEPREWPSGAIGCPGTGQSYAEYIIPGFLMEFTDGAKAYPVHTSLSEQPGEPMVFCDGQQPVDLSVPATGGTTDPTAQALVEQARQDLANELEVDAGAVTLVQVQQVDWPDSSLGCPQPGGTYLQVITPGYRIELDAQGRRYMYHTDRQTTLVRCETL
jgi:hypothetical protein